MCGLTVLCFFAGYGTTLLQRTGQDSDFVVSNRSNTLLQTHVRAEPTQQAKEAVHANLTSSGAGAVEEESKDFSRNSTLPSNVAWMPLMEADSLFKRAKLERVFAREVVSGFWATAEKERLLTRLHYAVPLAWLHIPKTGTTMAEVILHSRTLCPLFPEDYHLESGKASQLTTLRYFIRGHGRTKRLCNDSVLFWPLISHVHFQTMLNSNFGSAVTFFRHPAQHLVSFYFYFRRRYKWRTMNTMLRCCSHCQLTMLTHTGCFSGPLGLYNKYPPVVSHADVDHAIQWLQTRFAFIGITEQWNLSVCLFHAIFGGNGTAAEFANTRASRDVRRGGSHKTSQLQGMVPSFLVELYGFALRRFTFDVARYSVNERSCQYV